jgi:acyl-CoA synthetase (NDP forming)
VILLYLESIGNPRKFSRIARRVSRQKPIVAVRSGRATQGVPMGHAVRSIEVPQAAVDEMFRQAGVIQVDTLDEMFDVAQLLAHQQLPRGPRVGVVGNSDALGLLATDAAVASGLTVTSVVALGAEATADDFERALDDAIDDDEVDAVIAVYIPPLDSGGTEVADVLAAVGEQSEKPLVSTFLGREGIPELLRIPDLSGSTAGRGSVPSYPAVEAAVRALARVAEYAAWLERRDDGTATPVENVDLPAASRMVTQLLIDHVDGHDLDHEECRALLGHYGVDLWERAEVDDVEAAVEAGERMGWDVVLKATAAHVRQQPGLAHVWRNIADADEMRHAWDCLVRDVGPADRSGYVVQRTAVPGVPVAVGGLEDPLFGPAVSFQVAGSLTDLVGDKSYRIPPLTPLDAAELVRSIKAAPLLFGYRGSEPVDAPALEDLVRRVAQLKNDLPQVCAVNLDLVNASRRGVEVLSARVRVEPVTDPRSDSFVRRLNAQATSPAAPAPA